MAHIGIVTLYATGHIDPSIALGLGLKEQGHEVTFFNLPDTESAIREAGLNFVGYGQTDFPRGALPRLLATAGNLRGAAAFGNYLDRMRVLFDACFRELPQRIRAADPDLLLIDQVYFAGGTVAEHLGIPFLSVANALLVNREALIPPPNTLWAYEDSEAAVERNRLGWAAVDDLYRGLLLQVNTQREQWGLMPYANLLEDSFSDLGQICQQPEIFDFPRSEAPTNLSRVGHFNKRAEGVPFDWEWLDGRPLAYVTCGTLQNGLKDLFSNIILACEDLDIQVVVALGRGDLSADDFEGVPPNVKIVPYVPQRELLEKAALCVNHAGLNTVLDCLELGVPMIAIPIASEQPGIAMRVARLGTGVVVPHQHADVSAIRFAVEEVLRETRYSAAAKSVSRTLAADKPINEAVRIIESALR